MKQHIHKYDEGGVCTILDCGAIKGFKQHITPKQLNELSEKGLRRIQDWCTWNDYLESTWIDEDGADSREIHSPLLSIGQMIEFLVAKQDKGWRDLHIEMLHDIWQVGTCYDEGAEDGSWKFKDDKGELCDALWEAVKEVLEK